VRLSGGFASTEGAKCVSILHRERANNVGIGGFCLSVILFSILVGFVYVSKDLALNSIGSGNIYTFTSLVSIVFTYSTFLAFYFRFFRDSPPDKGERKRRYHYRHCWVLEEIANKQEESDLETNEYQDIVKKLEAKGYVKKGQKELTSDGKKHLKGAIKYSSEENKTALQYMEIFSGIVVILFVLLLQKELLPRNDMPHSEMLLNYVRSMLLFTIILSFGAASSYWHGCSADHGYVELRIYNGLGDSLMRFCSLILLSSLWIVFYFGLPREWHTDGKAMIFFAISFCVATYFIIWTIQSNFSAKKDKGTLREVIRDMVNLSTNVFRSGKWRVQKSHVIPFSSIGMGITFLAVSICGSIIPIIIIAKC